VRRVLTRLSGGSIVILHDGSSFGRVERGQTIAALEPILTRGAQLGLRAVSVGMLLEAGVPRWHLWGPGSGIPAPAGPTL